MCGDVIVVGLCTGGVRIFNFNEVRRRFTTFTLPSGTFGIYINIKLQETTSFIYESICLTIMSIIMLSENIIYIPSVFCFTTSVSTNVLICNKWFPLDLLQLHL